MKVKGSIKHKKDQRKRHCSYGVLHWLNYQEPFKSWKSRHRPSVVKFKGAGRIRGWERKLELWEITDDQPILNRKLTRPYYDSWG